MLVKRGHWCGTGDKPLPEVVPSLTQFPDAYICNFVMTGGTVSGHNDNLQCHQSQRNCQIDNLVIIVPAEDLLPNSVKDSKDFIQDSTSITYFIGRIFFWLILITNSPYIHTTSYVHEAVWPWIGSGNYKDRCDIFGISMISNTVLLILQHINSSDAEDGIFQHWGSIPCLLMHWLLKSSVYQQAWYWLCRTDNMYLNLIYLGQTTSKIWLKMPIYFL